MKEPDILKKFKLPSFVKGKNAAEASRLIEKRFKDREDAISLSTKKELLERLKMAQDYVKEAQGVKEVDPENNQFLFGGFSGAGTAAASATGAAAGTAGVGSALTGALALADQVTDESKFEGVDVDDPNAVDPGDIELSPEQDILTGTLTGLSAGASFGWMGAAIGAVAGAGAGVAGHYRKKYTKNEKDTDFLARKGNLRNNKYELGGLAGDCGGPGQPPCPELNTKDRETLRTKNALGLEFANDESGDAAINRLFTKKVPTEKAEVNLGKYRDVNYFGFDPSDATGRTLVRGAGQKYNDDAVKRQFKNIQTLNPGLELKYNNQYKYGGKMNQNQYKDGGKDPVEEIYKRSLGIKTLDTPGFQPVNILKNAPQYQKPGFGNQLSSFLKSDGFKNTAADTMRLAPAISNTVQALSLNPSDPVNLARTDYRYKPQYADEATAVNRINNVTGNLTEGVQNASRGSLGALRSNLLGAYATKNRMLSDEYNKMDAINRAENAKMQESGFRADRINIMQANREQEINDANEGAFNTEQSRMWSAAAQDYGNIGLEGTRMAYAKKMGLLYDSKGKYIGRVDKKTGKFISADEEAAKSK